MSQDLNLLEQMKKQCAGFIAQKSQAEINYQQILGAIYALESMIKKAEDELEGYEND